MTPLRAQAVSLASWITNEGPDHAAITDALEAFAKRVQEEEREACAKVIDKRAAWHKSGWDSNRIIYDELVECADAIRRQRGGQG